MSHWKSHYTFLQRKISQDFLDVPIKYVSEFTVPSHFLQVHMVGFPKTDLTFPLFPQSLLGLSFNHWFCSTVLFSFFVDISCSGPLLWAFSLFLFFLKFLLLLYFISFLSLIRFSFFLFLLVHFVIYSFLIFFSFFSEFDELSLHFFLFYLFLSNLWMPGFVLLTWDYLTQSRVLWYWILLCDYFPEVFLLFYFIFGEEGVFII